MVARITKQDPIYDGLEFDFPSHTAIFSHSNNRKKNQHLLVWKLNNNNCCVGSLFTATFSKVLKIFKLSLRTLQWIIRCAFRICSCSVSGYPSVSWLSLCSTRHMSVSFVAFWIFFRHWPKDRLKGRFWLTKVSFKKQWTNGSRLGKCNLSMCIEKGSAS